MKTPKDLQQSIHESISHLRKLAEERARTSPPPPVAPTAEEQPKKPKLTEEEQERQQLSIIPYPIIRCITQLDNIYETRLFGWVLAKAQSVLKLYNRDLSEINLQHALDLTRVTLPAKLILNEGDKNYCNVTKSFGLATKKITYERENRVYHLNIIAFPELIKDARRSMVTFVIHNEIWHALLDFSKGHRTFSLPTYIKLTSKYAVIMYLLCSNQSRPINYAVGTLKQLLGCNDKQSYERGFNFVKRVLEPSREELMSKAPYYFDYSCTKSGKSHEITEIIILPRVNPTPVSFDPVATRAACELRLRLDDDVKMYIQERFGMRPKPLEKLEPLITKLGNKPQQLAKLGEIWQQCTVRRVRNPSGYLTRSLQNHYRQQSQ
jgi:hypothetical protein